MIALFVLFWVSILFMVLGLIIPDKLNPNPDIPTRTKRMTITLVSLFFAAVFIILYVIFT